MALLSSPASSTSSPWEVAARLFEAPESRRRWQSPLAMAEALDPATVRTEALDLIDRTLVDVADGREDRLIVSMPPQEAKSTTISRWFPEWLLSNVDPDLRIISISYSDEVARRWGADVKRDFESYNGDEGSIDLGVRLRGDSRAAGRWQVDGHRGGMFCAGVSGSVTGRPADLLLIDDPIKDLEQAQSPVYRERFQRFWQAVAVPRLGPGARAVLIQTRWHEEDAAGWLIQTEGDRAQGGRWRVINIPAISEGAGDPLGRAVGVPMRSARGERDWDAIRRSVGSYVWSALYQGRPAPAEGGLFKRLKWRYWQPAGADRVLLGNIGVVDLRDTWRFGTVDLAASTKTSADWTVACAWALTLSGDLLLLGMNRAHADERHHFDLVRPLATRFALDTTFVERSQYGTTLAADAAREGVHLTPLTADANKLTRALPASARQEGGRLWLPPRRDTTGAPVPWVDLFIDEHAAFPNGRHDDIVDNTSYAVRVAIAEPMPTAPLPHQRAGEPEMNFMTREM